MVQKKQTPAVYFVAQDTDAEWLTRADIDEHELTEEQKEVVTEFEQLAQMYSQQVDLLDFKLVRNYQKLLKKQKKKQITQLLHPQ
jgi:transcriptional regulatory protein LevR